MAYIAPTIRSVGDAVTAADQNIIANDILQFAPFVQGVFTTETVRDAAITSPTEGMHAYITGSTIAAATGVTQLVPTGIQTIYNGSVWVCVTPIASNGGTTASTTSTTYVNTFTGDTTPISVTLVTGTTCRIDLAAGFANNVATASTYLSFAVSGATTIAASDANGTRYQVGDVYEKPITRLCMLTGLTSGTNTFTFNIRCSTSAATSSFSYRSIIVSGIA